MMWSTCVLLAVDKARFMKFSHSNPLLIFIDERTGRCPLSTQSFSMNSTSVEISRIVHTLEGSSNFLANFQLQIYDTN